MPLNPDILSDCGPYGPGFDNDLTLLYKFSEQPGLQASMNLGPTLGITRTTTATFLDWETKVRTAKAGEARFTGCRRVENLCLQSEDLSTTWNTVRSLDLVNVALAPDGTNTADRLRDSGAGGENTSYITQAITVPPGDHCFSIFLKADQLGWAVIETINFDVDALIFIDLVNGVLGTTPSVNTPGFQSAGIEDVGNGWFRCHIIANSISDLSGAIRVYLADSQGDRTVALDTTSSLLMWGFQLEMVDGQADQTPSDYVKTTTVAVAQLFATNRSGDSLATAVKGLLVEEARTNLCLQSEDFDTTWVDGGDTISTAAAAVAPDGAVTGFKLIDDNGGATGNVLSGQTLATWTASSDHTVSIYAKADGLNWIRLGVFGMASQALTVFYDLVNGVVGATVGADVDSTFIEDVGNGWFRCGFTFGSDGSDTQADIQVNVATGNNNVVVDLDNSSSVFVWGAQVELGGFPTSYIPTVASSVTRNKEDILTTDVGWLTSGTGTFFVEASQLKSNVLTDLLMDLSDNSTSDRIFLQSTNGGTAQAVVRAADANTALPSINTFVSGAVHRVALGYATNSAIFLNNGNASAEDTSVTPPTNVTDLNIGSSQGEAQQWNGHIAELRYYRVRKPTAFLTDLSNGKLPI